MRKAIFSFLLVFASLFGLLHSAQAADPGAAKIFETLKGTTTIDQGGSIHSQARSIYSLGGGQVSFQGKRVSLLAADPPSFSAGCSGISWHFGGFSFISMDEIRQLVEAIAQASLGVAVDLAMQVLCPQCYAVMSKLREIANMMRNAAADACKTARALGTRLLKEFGIDVPEKNQAICGSTKSEKGVSANWLNGVAGALCGGLNSVQKAGKEVGDEIMAYFNGTSTDKTKKPDQNLLYESGNITYRALSGLGYADGFVKDLLLSIIGMTVIHPVPNVDCKQAFKDLVGSNIPAGAPSIEEQIIATSSGREVKNAGKPVKPSDATPGTATTAPPGGATTGSTICQAPPLVKGVDELSTMLLCGPDPWANLRAFANLYFDGKIEAVKRTSLGSVCQGALEKAATTGTPPSVLADSVVPYLYTCRSDSAECREPKMVKASDLISTTQAGGFDGLVWMIGDALYDGAKRIRDGNALNAPTIAVLNGSDYPLYRLLNMAAIYKGLADDLLGAYGATIATQYAMDTMERVVRIGSQPAIDLKLQGGVAHNTIAITREQIMEIVRTGQAVKSQILARLAEKRNLVDVILQVNRTLQAEVVSKGLTGNADLAISLKRQAAPTVVDPAKPTP